VFLSPKNVKKGAGYTWVYTVIYFIVIDGMHSIATKTASANAANAKVRITAE